MDEIISGTLGSLYGIRFSASSAVEDDTAYLVTPVDARVSKDTYEKIQKAESSEELEAILSKVKAVKIYNLSPSYDDLLKPIRLDLDNDEDG